MVFTFDYSNSIPSQLRYYPSTREEIMKNMTEWTIWIHRVLKPKPQQYKAAIILVGHIISVDFRQLCLPGGLWMIDNCTFH